MADEIFMDVPEMRNLVKQFTDMEEKLKETSKAMEAQIQALKVAAFMGAVGAEAYRQWLEVMKPRVDRFAQRCNSMSVQLGGITDAYEKGDTQGAAAFTTVN